MINGLENWTDRSHKCSELCRIVCRRLINNPVSDEVINCRNIASSILQTTILDELDELEPTKSVLRPFCSLECLLDGLMFRNKSQIK